MKRLFGSFLSLALVACAAESGNPNIDSDLAAAGGSPVTVYHSSWTGGQASASYNDELSGGAVDAWQGTTRGGAAIASLNYNTFVVDPTSLVCVIEYYPPKGGGDPIPVEYCFYTRATYEYGWGSIPAADFAVKNGTALLDTTVAASDTFYIERCEVDYDDLE